MTFEPWMNTLNREDDPDGRIVADTLGDDEDPDHSPSRTLGSMVNLQVRRHEEQARGLTS